MSNKELIDAVGKYIDKPKLFIVQFHIQICTMNHKI